MEIQEKDWQKALQTWLQHNSKTIPHHLRQLREQFVQHFPMETLKDITLDQYAIGKPDSFCYWLEFKTKELGSISGGTSAKFGVWWSKSENRWRWNSSYQDAEQALFAMVEGIQALIHEANKQNFNAIDPLGKTRLGPNRYSLRSKPIYLYFPDYFLPISNPDHLKIFLQSFGEKPEGDITMLNRQLLTLLRSYAQFEGFDTYQMMIFLYENMLSKEHNTAPPTKMPTPIESDLITPPINKRTKVFISYSEEDKDDLERLQVHLRQTTKLSKPIEWWDTTQIQPGKHRDEEIKKALASTSIAILLISVDYIASSSIYENQLLPLLTASEAEGVTILPVIIGPCIFTRTKIARFQAVNNPEEPLSSKEKHEKDRIWNIVINSILHSDDSE